MADERDIAEQIKTIRGDIAALTESVSLLVTDIAGIQTSLMQRESSAAWGAVKEAEELGGEAMHAAGAWRGRRSVEVEIERNRLMALFIALGVWDRDRETDPLVMRRPTSPSWKSGARHALHDGFRHGAPPPHPCAEKCSPLEQFSLRVS